MEISIFVLEGKYWKNSPLIVTENNLVDLNKADQDLVLTHLELSSNEDA